MHFKKFYIFLPALIILAIAALNAYMPIRNFVSPPRTWTGASLTRSGSPEYDPRKKTVFIIADHKLTVLFDMLAPFYLFNATEKANVYIVAREKTPILIRRDLFVCPQLTFNEADSMGWAADAIVVPALSARDEHQDAPVTAWIKKHFASGTKLLTICDGASTGAATGLYDGKPMTCHATGFENMRTHFSKPRWVQDISVAKSGNVFSTAGVSNAVEGSLLVIRELFGPDVAKNVAAAIKYPHEGIRLTHQSIALSSGDILAALRKVLFRSNKNIGFLLDDGIDEFSMATILEIYGRTFPASFRTCILKGPTVRTRYGLTLIYRGNSDVKGLDEIYMATPGDLSADDALPFGSIKTIRYDTIQQQYLFDVCLRDIAAQYGRPFEKFVRISLDYN